jgi:predicted ATP-grasp superfamily ATP-dependent carboligase
MPVALDEIRKFGRLGHRMFASDTFAGAPGSHSRFVAKTLVTPSPRYDPISFLLALRRFIADEHIELVVPSFEEVFYMARHPQLLGADVGLFASDFATLAMLHDKVRFLSLATSLGLAVPRHLPVTDRDQLRAATKEFGRFFARPVYSRGGVLLYTNAGPLAGAVQIDECHPSPAAPWIVQEFVHGEDVCSFSIAHDGHIAAHSTYVHPRTIEHAGGIVFESIVEPEGLTITRRIAEACCYTGQLSLDFMRTPAGLVLIECNPRPTSGCYIMPDGMFVEAVLHPDRSRTMVAPAGARRKVSVALIRDMLLHWKEAPADLAALLKRGRDVYADPGDLVPAIYQFISYGHVREYRKNLAGVEQKPSDLMAAYFYDVCWDGEEIPSAPAVAEHFAQRTFAHRST